MADSFVIGYVLNPDEGQAIFDGLELSQDFVYGDMDIGHDRFQDQVRVSGDHGFVGVFPYGQELRGIDITVHEEGFVWVLVGDGIQVFPFFVCTVEVITDGDSDDFIHWESPGNSNSWKVS
jgi:hypothetical protein